MLLHALTSGLGPQPPWAAQRPWEAGHPLLEQALDLLCRPWGPFPGERSEQRPRLAFCLRSGQWVAERDGAGRLHGFLTWERASDMESLATADEAAVLWGWMPWPRDPEGHLLYVVDAAVAEQAPPGTALRLVRRAIRASPWAQSICCHRVRADGRRAFRVRALRGGV